MAAARAAAAEYSTAGAGDGAVASDLNDLSKLGQITKGTQSMAPYSFFKGLGFP